MGLGEIRHGALARDNVGGEEMVDKNRNVSGRERKGGT